MTDTRWIVERSPDSFEDVGADFYEIVDGCLVFYSGQFLDRQKVYTIAAGHWITVVPE